MSAPFADTAAPGERGPSKAGLFWPAVLVITAGDVLTKYWAHRHLEWGEPVRVAGDVFRLRLNYNPGAAFGMYLGAHSPARSIWISSAGRAPASSAAPSSRCSRSTLSTD